MDPHANVVEATSLARGILERGGDHIDVIEAATRLAELVIALHEWRTNGGFDPYAATTGDLDCALTQAHKALWSDSNDFEHECLAMLVDAIEEGRKPIRATRLHKLIRHYDPACGEYVPDDFENEQFALVQQETGHGLDGTNITVHATFAAACEFAGSTITEGWGPVGVFDLESGELINLHVTSVVTRNEDQGTLTNPLSEENG
jgi:hypothetical protein